ncbi:MAG: DMT family transporter [Gemmobacter sp.]
MAPPLGRAALHAGSSEALRGHLAMLAFSALVAGSFSLGALSANHVDPAAFTTLRFLIAAVLLGAAAALGPGFSRMTLVRPGRWFLLGGLFAAYFVLMFEGLKTAAPVSAAAVFTLTPVMSAGFGWLLLRQVTTPRMAAALAIGAVGALWVIFRADLSAALGFALGRGEAIYLAGCVAHALFTPLLAYVNRGEPALVATALVMAAGCLLLAIWSAPALTATDWAALPAIVWATLIYVAVFASAVTFFLLQYAAMNLPSAKVMAYTYLVPSWVILWELALGQSPPPLLVGIGIGLTVTALVILLKAEPAKPRSRPASPGEMPGVQGDVRSPPASSAARNRSKSSRFTGSN